MKKKSPKADSKNASKGGFGLSKTYAKAATNKGKQQNPKQNSSNAKFSNTKNK